MNRVLLVEDIQLPTNVVHTLKKPKQLFPFTTHAAKYIEGNFNIIISELARNITNFQLNKKKLEGISYQYFEGAQKLSEFIANSNQIDFQEDDSARIDFIRFIDAYLFNEDQIKIVHTYLYNFIGESESNQTVLRNLAEFINSVFIEDNEEIKQIFKNKETDDILMKLIISEIEDLVEEKKKSQKTEYSNIFPNFVQVFQDDIQYLMKHKDYFIANFERLLNYYVFMYICQSIIQLEKMELGSYDELEPLYFALDWEAVTKKRLVYSSMSGYKSIKEHASNLFAHEFVLRSLSFNVFNLNKESGFDVVSYRQLLDEISSHGEEYEKQLNEDLKDWIAKYCTWSKQAHPDLPESTEGCLKLYLNLVKNAMNDSAQTKYGNSLEYLGKGTFLKQRGSLGYLLNMQHDFLMLMTATIVKDQRMPFKTLLNEFEKRGIIFDRHSIEEIVVLFNNHNILDKKSDSGDAQYVKPIL